MQKRLRLACLLLGTVMVANWQVAAQVPTTTVQDTVYRADGTPAGGTVVVSWGAFTTAGRAAVPAGTASATIGAGGVVTLSLAANAGSTPMGSYYTAVFHLNDGTTSREYWVVPVSVPGGAPAKLAAIRNQVLPASVAMQTVSKAYVDNAIAAAETGFPTNDSPYVLKAGDTMAGPLVLAADPVSANQAADKNYVDTNVAAVGAGVAQKVSLAPPASQAVVQPSGTELQVNHLNGELSASQYVSGNGNNGIANALGSPDCANGCEVKVGTDYNSQEQVNTAVMPGSSQVVDFRGGALGITARNPFAVGQTGSAGQNVHLVETESGPELEAAHPGAIGVGAVALQLTTDAQAGGSNQFPEHMESSYPYAKSTYGTLSMLGRYNTQGQHVQMQNEVNCYAVGDCLAGGQFITTSGGYRDSADEGAHPWDLTLTEDTHVFTGTCGSGCTTGSTSVAVTNISGNGTQGDGRFLIDKNPANVISAGTITGGGRTILGTVSFSGTNFPVSVFLSTTAAALSQPTNMAPGTVTLPIATSGVSTGFATSTAALPATSGIACVVGPMTNGQELLNYEMAPYTVVDASHLQLTLNKVHTAGTVIAVGGLCGYGLEQTVDTTNGIRQLFPVVGSTGPGSLYYTDSGTTVVGNTVPWNTSGYQNLNLGVASITRSGNLTTVTTAGSFPWDVNGLTFTVSGVADSSFNGSFAVTTTGANTLTYANTGADSTSTGGTISFVTGGFALYPMAEVLSVLDAATRQVDGQLTLAPNTVAWAAGDPVEEPHYFQQLTYADTEVVTQFVPRPLQFTSQGKSYYGQVGPGFRGWEITNGVPASTYLGAGGTHQPPDDAHVVSGVWANDFEVDAGVNAVLRVHCNLHTCGRWDSNYRLFDLDSANGEDSLNYSPSGHAVWWQLGGTSYGFSPGGFSAGTVTAGVINATTINGSVGGDLSGTYSTPTVNAVHAVSGTLDGVTIGSTTPAAATVSTLSTVPANCQDCVAATFASGGSVATDLVLKNTSLGGHSFAFFSTGSTNGPGYFGVYDSTAGSGPLAVTGGVNGGAASVSTGSTAVIGWSSQTNAFSAVPDTGLSRESADVVDCGNGTPGDASCTLKAGKLAAANGYTGTKTIGSCTLVITAGIITNVTGC